jgi:hypothetical protein
MTAGKEYLVFGECHSSFTVKDNLKQLLMKNSLLWIIYFPQSILFPHYIGDNRRFVHSHQDLLSIEEDWL